MNKTTQHIGQLSGKILVFGGVYSNFQALEKLMSIAEKTQISPSNIICTGDIVAYCAEPEACVKAIRDWGIHSILGNVEIQLRDDLEDCGCNFNDGSRCDVLSRQWYPYAQAQMSSESKKWFHSLPDHIKFDYANKKIVVVHGDALETSGYVFKSTDWRTKQNSFEQLNADIILGGHSGLPFSDVNNGQYWLNAGVIGMPANDAKTHVWYMILDDAPFSFEHHSFEYDYKKAFDLMQKNHLPAQYAQTLKTGLWDNCEILPEKETAAQGQPIFKKIEKVI
jgi:predicted phosphodiesterase